MCVFYQTCVEITQHLSVWVFHTCLVISTRMCNKTHLCGESHTAGPCVVCDYIYMTLTLSNTNFLTPTRFWSSSFEINARFWSISLKCMIDLVINAGSVIIHLLRQAFWSVICFCSTFLHCVFSHVSLNRLPDRMQSHTGYICLTFLDCAFSNISSNHLHEKMQSHTGCIWKPIVTFVCLCTVEKNHTTATSVVLHPLCWAIWKCTMKKSRANATNVTIGFQMQPVWLCIFSCRRFEETFENAQLRKVKQI